MNKETIKAIVSLAVLIIINLGAHFGIEVDNSMAMNVACGVLAVGSVAWAAWKNHNFTTAAQMAQGALEAFKQIQSAADAGRGEDTDRSDDADADTIEQTIEDTEEAEG